MEERLVTFMQQMGLSSGQLADRLGVQRSGISHLLSGRNKPSYDFIQKFIIAFPTVNAEWLLTGKGAMLRPEQPSDLFSINGEKEATRSRDETRPAEAEDTTSVNNREMPDKRMNGPKKIIQVMVFYADGTFTIYTPEREK
jgi:transcriptional regulator with XRE-family HTH domain